MRFLACALILASASAIACPDLSGHWARCTSTSGNPGSSDVIATQSVSGGITTYTVTETDDETQERSTESVVANGVATTSVDNSDGMNVETTTTATCVGDASLNFVSSIKFNGQDIGTVTAVITKENGQLITRTAGSFMGQDMSDVSTCQ